MDSTQDLARMVASTLSPLAGGCVTVSRIELLKSWNRHTTARCFLSPAPGMPERVVVKWCHTPAAGEMLQRDWASLAFLSLVQADSGLVPVFLAGDAKDHFFVMEDLGPGPTLEDLRSRSESTPQELVPEFIALAGRLGELHARSLGRKEDYLATATRHGLLMPDVHLVESQKFLSRWRAVSELCRQVGVPLQSAAAGEYAAVASHMANPGAFLAYTHGDVAPSNVYMGRSKPAFFDFEYGGFRHALYDAMFWWATFPVSEHLKEQMDAAYRSSLAAALPEAADDNLYWERLAQVAAYHALFYLDALLPQSLVEDGTWAESITTRQALLYKLRVFVRLADRSGRLPVLKSAVHRLHDVLKNRWPQHVATMPVVTFCSR